MPTVKITIMGPEASGKSSIVNRLVEDQVRFSDFYNATVGVTFHSKILSINENQKYSLQIWDTSGQKTFQGIIGSYCKNIAIIVLVVDPYNLISVESLLDFYKLIKANVPNLKEFILVENKSDLAGTGIKCTDGIEKFLNTCRKNNVVVHQLECSAKLDRGINDIQSTILKIYEKRQASVEIKEEPIANPPKPSIPNRLFSFFCCCCKSNNNAISSDESERLYRSIEQS